MIDRTEKLTFAICAARYNEFRCKGLLKSILISDIIVKQKVQTMHHLNLFIDKFPVVLNFR